MKLVIEDRPALVSRIESIIREETYVNSYGGCSCCSDYELEDVDDAAERIVKLIETDLLTS